MSRFPFTFFPRKLAEERSELEKKFASLEERNLELRLAEWYPRMIKEIAALLDEGQSLERYADALSTLQLKILSHALSDTLKTETLTRRVYQILTRRINYDIIRAAWISYQHDFQNQELEKLLRAGAEIGEEWISGLASLLQTGEFLPNIIHHVTYSESLLKDTLTDWRVIPSTNLAKHVRFEMLRAGLSTDSLLAREGMQVVRGWLSDYSLEEYKRLLTQYVTDRSHERYHKGLLLQARERLKDPRTEPSNWEFIEPDTFRNVREWFKLEELKEFFEKDSNNRRFLFWKRYTRDMHDVDAHSMKHVIVMDFGNFVAVEFVDMVGAAYFYYKEGFIRHFEEGKKMRGPQDYKVKARRVIDYNLYINSLAHQGASWENKFSRYIHDYLRGHL